ncbi:MAG: hypothetical protein HRU26_01080 [Psychroserpens sp.]|nr:hypothetical protein [Psychroserpens sp.]
MKRSILICAVLLLFTAFKCDNEPLEGEFVSESQVSCEIAIQNVEEAFQVFENAEDNNYTELCLAYRNALIRQIEFCGDPGGVLQNEIDALGNCGQIQFVDDCVAAAAAVGEAQAAFALATPENYTELCIAYRETLFQLLEFCGEDGGTQSVINGLGD